MNPIADFFGPDIALFVNFILYSFISYLAYLFSLHIPTFTSYVSSIDNALFFCVFTLFFAFLLGLAVRSRSVFCHVWASFVVVVCACVLSSRMAGEMKVENLRDYEMRMFEVNRELMAYRRALREDFMNTCKNPVAGLQFAR